MTAEHSEAADLADVFGALAAKLGEVHIELRGSRAEYRRGKIIFATAEAASAELRLDGDIAEAARRTPSTSTSPRGAEWVTFSPPQLDDHAVDRAQAWFMSAWRIAGRS